MAEEIREMTAYEWIEGKPVQTNNNDYQWVAGKPYVLIEKKEKRCRVIGII